MATLRWRLCSSLGTSQEMATLCLEPPHARLSIRIKKFCYGPNSRSHSGCHDDHS